MKKFRKILTEIKNYAIKYRKNKRRKKDTKKGHKKSKPETLRYIRQDDTNEISSIANKSKLRHGTYQNSELKLYSHVR